MTPDDLWRRYAALWSTNPRERDDEMAACLADEVAYCDPHIEVTGRATLAAYMDGFQQNVPGGYFVISSVQHHHRHTFARWSLRGADGQTLQTGASFGLLSDNNRLQTITGFFPLANEAT